jgi:ferrochelatase
MSTTGDDPTPDPAPTRAVTTAPFDSGWFEPCICPAGPQGLPCRRYKAEVGILLQNLGTPDAPTTPALRRYLREFLSDRRVVDVWRPLWLALLYGIILRTRPPRSARAYRSIWTDAGSPLMVGTTALARKLEAALADRLGTAVPVVVGMRYGSPSIAAALAEMRARGINKVLVLPMFPQYSAPTTATVLDAVADALRREPFIPELRMVREYPTEPGYIAALAASIREVWERDGEPDHLLMSFHGVPKRYIAEGDAYYCQCLLTGSALREALGRDESNSSITFQSRFGTEEWLKPYTDVTFEELPGRGVKRLDVVCPGFAVDCLETLEEIAIEGRDEFLEAGGEAFRYIPCLNERDDHVAVFADLAARHLQGWL